MITPDDIIWCGTWTGAANPNEPRRTRGEPTANTRIPLEHSVIGS